MTTAAKDPGQLYRLAILGDGGVGKTALTIQLCLNQFVETYDPTIEDSYRKKVVLDGEPTTLEVLDTAGQEEYTALRDQWIRDGEGFLLVYSISSRSSFSRIKPYYNQILRVKDGDPFGAVLVGNKSDRAHERQVAVQEGEQLAKELGIPFYEASAKLNINAETAFLVCARTTRDIRRKEDELFGHEHPDDTINSSGAISTPISPNTAFDPSNQAANQQPVVPLPGTTDGPNLSSTDIGNHTLPPSAMPAQPNHNEVPTNLAVHNEKEDRRSVRREAREQRRSSRGHSQDKERHSSETGEKKKKKRCVVM